MSHLHREKSQFPFANVMSGKSISQADCCDMHNQLSVWITRTIFLASYERIKAYKGGDSVKVDNVLVEIGNVEPADWNVSAFHHSFSSTKI